MPDQQLIAANPPALVLVLGDLTYANPNGQLSADQHFNDMMVWSAGHPLYAGMGKSRMGPTKI